MSNLQNNFKNEVNPDIKSIEFSHFYYIYNFVAFSPAWTNTVLYFV